MSVLRKKQDLTLLEGSFDTVGFSSAGRSTNGRTTVLPSAKKPMLMGLATAFCLASVIGLYSNLAPFSSVTAVEGLYQTEEEQRSVYAPESGAVISVPFREGAKVHKGDILVQLDDPLARAELDSANAAISQEKTRLKRIAAEQDGNTMFEENGLKNAQQSPFLKSQVRLLRAKRESDEIDLLAFSAENGQIGATIAFVENESAELDGRIGVTREEQRTTAVLVKQGDASVYHLNDIKRSLSEQVTARDELQSRLGQLLLDRTMLTVRHKREILHAQQDAEHERSELVKNLSDLERKANFLETIHTRMAIRAPIDGVVSQLIYKTSGQVVSAGAAMAEILPEDEGSHVVAYADISLIKRIHVGQRAELKPYGGDAPDGRKRFGVIQSVVQDPVHPERGVRVVLTTERISTIEDAPVKTGLPVRVVF